MTKQKSHSFLQDAVPAIVVDGHHLIMNRQGWAELSFIQMLPMQEKDEPRRGLVISRLRISKQQLEQLEKDIHDALLERNENN